MKKGRVLIILAIIFGTLILVSFGAGIYFYKFHVFKELRVCVSHGEGELTNVSCIVDSDCLNYLKENLEEWRSVENAPSFLQEEVENIFSEAVYCNANCYIREVRGLGDFGELESCNEGEKEVLIQIKGKEGLELLDYAKQISS